MSRRLILWFGLALFSFSLIVSCNPPQASSPPASPTQRIELTLSAAASLQDVLTDIQALYAQQQPQVSLIYNFGSSGSLQQQIEQGAPVDVFIAAAAKQMDALQNKGLLRHETRKNLLTNQIALVTAKINTAKINATERGTTAKDFQSLASEPLNTIAIGDPESVPAGKYAEEVLSSLGIFEQVKPKLILAKDVRQVLSYVETGNAEAGMVYVTDAKTSDAVDVVAIAPLGSHAPIVYPVAVLKDSQHAEAATAFVDFLSQAQAQAVFEQHGFAMAKTN